MVPTITQRQILPAWPVCTVVASRGWFAIILSVISPLKGSKKPPFRSTDTPNGRNTMLDWSGKGIQSGRLPVIRHSIEIRKWKCFHLVSGSDCRSKTFVLLSISLYKLVSCKHDRIKSRGYFFVRSALSTTPWRCRKTQTDWNERLRYNQPLLITESIASDSRVVTAVFMWWQSNFRIKSTVPLVFTFFLCFFDWPSAHNN